ncbi:phage terminase large subunit family protein, partial [Anoxybacillus sp. LAT_11]|uniref:phage terminase large subunit family protein n=1 Tax=Anoxybacillus sp. LAT_11 TaxID=2862718 RepID=UPI0023B00956
MAQAFSKDRLAPMLRDSPALQGKVADARSRDSGNTVLHKTFPGGHITMVGANSPSSLASRPIRILLADEVDRFPASA